MLTVLNQFDSSISLRHSTRNNMRTIADVKRYIDSGLLNALDRPDMYASSPECLEQLLSLQDRMRLEIIGLDRYQHEFGYTAYLMSQGYGAANFCYRQCESGESITKAELFARLVQFWREYFRSEYCVEHPQVQADDET